MTLFGGSFSCLGKKALSAYYFQPAILPKFTANFVYTQ